MVEYKLLYFSLRARAEFIRYVFHQAGQEFEDKHVTFEEWPKLKETMPLGQLPVLCVDGKCLSQSVAIGVFVARRLGLAGDNDFEAARCEMVCQAIQDFITDHHDYVFTVVRLQDMEKAKEIWSKVKQDSLPKFLGLMDNLLSKNGTGWFVGDKVSVADMCVAEYLGRMEEVTDPTALDDFPALRAHYKKVHELPNIKKYVASRKKMPF